MSEAIVKILVLPLALIGAQMIQLRDVVVLATSSWNRLCCAAIVVGTLFLDTLGPRSLASEGRALWIAMTWPRGLENLLKAKARLWSLFATLLVTLILAWAMVAFPSERLQVALVGVGWAIFARGMSERSVTLVSLPSASGEPQPIPRGRRVATRLGMMTFAIGVFREQWQLAINGIVFSWLTSAAMWQNLRARLPYIFDPWSEELPKPPTLMHAMIAISAFIEVSAIVVSVAAMAFGATDRVGLAMPLSYAIAASAVCFGTMVFLEGRGVFLEDVFGWEKPGEPGTNIAADPSRGFLRTFGPWLALGIAIGGLLGVAAHGYEIVARMIPAVDALLQDSERQLSQLRPPLRAPFALMSIALAPFAEEFLFRGLLFRALDREWGGWRAVMGSAAFFAVYHNPYGWVPVFAVGIATAVLFKRAGHLAPSIALHIVYDAVVMMWDALG